MSGKMRRIKLASGEQIDVPEENAVGLMEELDRAGLPFSSDGEPPPSAAENAPPTPTAPQASEAPLGPPRREGEGFSDSGGGGPENDERSIWQRFVDTVRQAPTPGKVAARPAAQAMGGGFEHGITGGLAKAIPGGMGDFAREMDDSARAQNPKLYAAADAGGAMAMPVGAALRGVGLAREGGIAANVASNALEGGVQGAVREYSDTEGDTGERALAALAQGGEDALQGGAMTAALSGAGAVSNAAADYLGQRANMNRAASAGFYGSTLERLGDNKGDDYVADMGRRMEEQGLHQGRAPGGNWNPLNWLPQNAGTIAKNSEDLRKVAGNDMGLAESELGRMDAPPQVDVRGMIAKQGAPVRGADIDPVAGDAEQGFRRQMADRAAQLAPEGQMPFNDALDRRRYLDDQVNYAKKGGYEGAGMQEQVRREMANDLRGGISDSLDQGVAGGSVDPEVAQQWQRGRGNYELASDVGDAARSRSMREQGNQLLSLPTHALVGGALGGALGGGLPGAAAAAIGGQMLKTRGRAGLAGMQRGASNMMGPAGRAASWIGDNAPLGRIAALDAGGMPDNGDDALRSMGEQLSKTQQEGRGYLLPQAVKQALQTGELGPYAQAFEGKDDEGDIQIELDRLERTDPEFKRRVMPRLMQMTAER